MPKFSVQKSIIIQASPEVVFTTISNFHHWIHWSPWHILDPESQWNIAADGQFYSWEGKLIGSGNMRIREARPNTYLGYDLQFIKPWKSFSSDYFELQPTGEGTRITWVMQSKLPFFFFFLKKYMEAAIGMDFVRGLVMLKDYIERGSVPSRMEFKKAVQHPEFYYIGKKSTQILPEVGPVMAADYVELSQYLAAHPGLAAGFPIAFYPKMDLVTQQTTFISAFPVSRIPEDLPKNFVSGYVPATQTWVIQHTGAYRHLGNAWSAMSSQQRNRVARFSKKAWPFEKYLNDPQTTPEDALLTELHFTLK